MVAVDLEKIEQEIIRRLSAVNLGSGVIENVEAVKRFFEVLQISPRPIECVTDGRHAHALLANSDLKMAGDELRAADRAIFRAPDEGERNAWETARDTAKTTGFGDQLEIVKQLLRGYPMILSVPWRFYRGRDTGDRGRRTSPAESPVWEAAGDVLDFAARAAAECSDGRSRKEHPKHAVNFLDFVAAYEAGMWLFWITPSQIVVLPRPVLRLNLGRQLHSSDRSALRWPKGEEYFFLNGVQVSKEIVETPARDLRATVLLTERNAEVRREIVRKIGIKRICRDLHAQSIDRQGEYELLLLDLQDGRLRPFLKMRNPSIGVYHVEGVSPECRTVAEALAWRNQTDVPPSILT